MAARVLDNGGPTAVLQAQAADGTGGEGGAAADRRDGELRRMAAFRIRETANRIATLANSSRDETLRRELLAICKTLLREERLLLGESANG